MKYFKHQALLVAAALIVGCSSENKSETTDSSLGTSKEKPVVDNKEQLGNPEWNRSELEDNEASLHLTLKSENKEDFCSGKRGVVTVSWSLSKSYLEPQVWVQNGKKPRLFTSPRNHNSSEDTENWTKKSTIFFLVDKESNKLLKEIKAEDHICK